MGIKKLFKSVLLIFSFLMLCSYFPTFFGGVANAAERLKTDCTDNATENSVFPYGFFCGSAGTRYKPVQIDTDQKEGSNQTPSDELTAKYNLAYGTSYVDVKIAYRPEGIPRTSPGGAKAQVMIWSTIDAPGGDEFVQNAVTTNGSNGHSYEKCPGAGGAKSPGVVYGQGVYKDDVPHPQATDASPYGWDGTSGQVNCDTGGKMVYWTNKDAPSPGTQSDTYTYRVQLNPAKYNYTFCMRGDISVHYSPGDRDFPISGSNDYNNDNSTASHLARQSKRLCLSVDSPPPPPQTTQPTIVNSCTKTRVEVPDQIIPQGAVNKRDASAVVTIARTNNNTTGYVIYGGDSHTWQYAAADQTMHVKVVFRWKDSKGAWHNDTGNPNNVDQDISCWHASCSIASVMGDGPSHALLKGGTAHVRVNITNDGPQTLYSKFYDQYPNGGTAHTISATNGDGAHSRGFGLNRGGTDWIDVDVAVSNSVGYFDTSFTPEYAGAGGFRLGPDCSVGGSVGPQPIYEPFNVSVSAETDFTDGNENPSAIDGKSFVTITGTGRAVNVNTVFSRFYKVGGPDYQYVTGGTYQGNKSPVVAKSINPSGESAGDKYCTDILSTISSGYIGPGGSSDVLVNDDSDLFQQNCDFIHDEPYVHVFGSDITAGGCFGVGCAPTGKGSISTSTSDAAVRATGSGAQFGASAINFINGLKTASLRNLFPTSPAGLTFANTDVGASGKNYGGKLTGAVRQLKNYFEDHGALTPGSSNVLDNSIPGGAYSLPSGSVISGANIANGVQKTIYVDGDVHINGNISYAGASNFGDISQNSIPSVMIIARNIFIDNNVTQLDGLYVAQPSNNVNGYITTCSVPGANKLLNPNTLYDNCKNQLTVNGAFIADRVFLERTHASLRNSQAGEYPGLNTARSCGPAFGSKQDCAAEVFNYSPEMFMTQTPANGPAPETGPSSKKYDYITSLQPVL